MSDTMTHQGQQETVDNVVELFPATSANEPGVPPLTAAEILQLREFMRDFAIIRATCPMAIRSLSKR